MFDNIGILQTFYNFSLLLTPIKYLYFGDFVRLFMQFLSRILFLR